MSHNIASDREEKSAANVRRLYRTIRQDVEDSDGGWNGADVVEVLCEWFKRHGFNVEGPNPWADKD